nr:multiple PDZ domain protein-like [Dermatophagoides farinae]
MDLNRNSVAKMIQNDDDDNRKKETIIREKNQDFMIPSTTTSNDDDHQSSSKKNILNVETYICRDKNNNDDNFQNSVSKDIDKQDYNDDDDGDENEIYENENNLNQIRTTTATISTTDKLIVQNDITSLSSSSISKRKWGQEILVELIRNENSGFGISIIGGKEMITNNNGNHHHHQHHTAAATILTGILIKKILPDSPAAKCGLMKMGDRLLEVDGNDLRLATHDEAVDVIKKAKNPVKFLIQTLLPLNKQQQQHIIHLSSISSTIDKESLQPPPLSSSNSTLDDEKFSVTSAANIPLTQQEIDESLPEDIIEDEYGYSIKKIRKKYADIDGTTILVDLHKGMAGLGISLAGNRDRKKMSVFICGMHPKGSAYKDGRLCIGDEILEVNGIVLYGRSHLNASAIIKSLACPTYRIIVLRRDGALAEMAVKPLTQFPVHLEDFLEEKYCKFKGVRTITVRKATQGLGIMIIEGKRPDVGRGVFVSDIQDGSPAENAGLSVGDMILCVNHIDLIGADYETAANALKCAEGLLTLVIAKPIKLIPYEQQSLSTTTTTSPNVLTDHHHHHTKSNKIQVSMNKNESIKSPSITTTAAAAAFRSDDITSTTSQHHQNDPNLLPQQQTTTTTYEWYVECDRKYTSLSSSTTLASGINNELQQSSNDYKTCPVRLCEETTIEIIREKIGLGLSIVGGSDTPLNTVIIHEVYPNGAAYIDGRLKPGDQILEVNGENLRHATHEQAIKALRQTPPIIKMKIYRDKNHDNFIANNNNNNDFISQHENLQIFDVKLTKKPGKGLGLSIVVRRDGNGIYIKDIVEGGIADLDGHLMIGDQIIKVNGRDLTNVEDAALLLKTAKGMINLKIGRLKCGQLPPPPPPPPSSSALQPPHHHHHHQ